jgi:Tol biopolymer transport system component
MRKSHFFLLTLLLLILPLAYVGADGDKDLLLVTVSGKQGENISLDLYDPAKNVSTPILQGIDYSHAMVNRAGWVAYSAASEGHIQLHNWGSSRPEQKPIQIIGSEDADESPLVWDTNYNFLAFQSIGRDGHARIFVWNSSTSGDITPGNEVRRAVSYGNVVWSPDGRYLTFEAYQTEYSGHIYVFDGKNIMDIAPQDAGNIIKYYDNPVWSADGRLAFKGVFSGDMRSEIYVWDGHSTMNVSQNPTGGDAYPVWSADGQLAYQAEWDMDYNILIWDGVSMKDGQPDASTFVKATPYLNRSIPTWTSAGQVAYTLQLPKDRHPQVYMWDGTTAIHMSQNPNIDNFTPVWNRDGRWAFMAHGSTEDFLMVRDADNQTLLMTQAYTYIQPTWSLNGDLAFCRQDQSEWILAVLNGEDVHEVAHGTHIRAQWQSGASVVCTSG